MACKEANKGELRSRNVQKIEQTWIILLQASKILQRMKVIGMTGRSHLNKWG